MYSTTLTTVPIGRTGVEREFEPRAIRQLKASSQRDITVGGPHLAGQAIRAGLVDELCYTIAPHLVGGEHPRTVGADGIPATLELALLVEQDSTIMGRWFVRK